jgi:hypothetical protein
MEATAAPAMPEISIGQIPQIPQPSETGTPSIFARTTGHEAVSEPIQMTPNQTLEQRKLENTQRQRQQDLAEIDASNLAPEYKEAIKAARFGLSGAAGIEAAHIRGTNRAEIEKQKESTQGKRVFYRVPGSTPGSSNVVNYIERGGKLYDESDNLVSLPSNTVTLKEGYVVTTDDNGNVNVINPQAAVGPSNYRATISGAGKTYHPPSNSPANATDLSPEALNAEANYFRQTHDFSKWGMGAQAGVRQKIANRAMELEKAENPGASINYAEKAASWVAGNRNQKMIRSLDAVEGGLNTVIATSKEFSRSEIGILNNIILKGEVQLNNPKAIRFQTAVQGVIDDLASALSGGGATTDAARNQAKLIFNSAYSQGGLEAAIGSVREVMAARRTAFAAGTVYEKSAETSDARKKRLIEKYGAK